MTLANWVAIMVSENNGHPLVVRLQENSSLLVIGGNLVNGHVTLLADHKDFLGGLRFVVQVWEEVDDEESGNGFWQDVSFPEDHKSILEALNKGQMVVVS